MKITIQLDCPERSYRRSFEAKLPVGGGKELFQELVSTVYRFEHRNAIHEVFEELKELSSEELDALFEKSSSDSLD